MKAWKRAGIVAVGDEISGDMNESAAQDLNFIVNDLAKRGYTLWLTETLEAWLNPPDVVLHNNILYYCFQPHTSSAENEPGVGEDWQKYWYKSDYFESTTDWLVDTEYTDGATVELDVNTAAIEKAVIRIDDYDYPLELINRFQKLDIPNKFQIAQPSLLHFDRYSKIPKLTVRDIPDRKYLLKYTRVRLADTVTKASDTPDTPNTWLNYLIYRLAAVQGEEYNVPERKLARLHALADAELSLNLKDSREETDDQFIQPTY